MFKGIITAQDFRDINGNSMLTTNKTKIKAEAIETEKLIVGQNIQMGENATINWEQVMGTPDIIDSSTVTQIARNEIRTARIYANQIQTDGLGAERIYKPSSPSSYACIDGMGDLVLHYNNRETFRTYWDATVMELRCFQNSFLVTDGIRTRAKGTWDFTDATINGFVAMFA